MKHKPSVTIAVCAYNEAQNIVSFLTSVLSQKEEGFNLEKILVVSDGSTDETVNRVTKLNSPKIETWNLLQRLGKSPRLNQIYRALTSDLLVQSDADVTFTHPHVLRDLIQPLILEKKVGMCGGNPQPQTGTTFIEKAVNCTTNAFIPLRWQFRRGQNILSADGRLLAYQKELVKKINIPHDMIANDAYTYFCCLTLGYQYRFVKSASVTYRSPQTISDQIRQNSRFLAASQRLKKYFPAEIVDHEYQFPKSILRKQMLTQFIKHPILCAVIFILNKYCYIRSRLIEPKLTSKWDIAGSTKKLITHL